LGPKRHMEVANNVAFEANFSKKAEWGCYGVGNRWGLVAGRRRVRFNWCDAEHPTGNPR
jgi:hypothetical protein